MQNGSMAKATACVAMRAGKGRMAKGQRGGGGIKAKRVERRPREGKVRA